MLWHNSNQHTSTPVHSTDNTYSFFFSFCSFIIMALPGPNYQRKHALNCFHATRKKPALKVVTFFPPSSFAGTRANNTRCTAVYYPSVYIIHLYVSVRVRHTNRTQKHAHTSCVQWTLFGLYFFIFLLVGCCKISCPKNEKSPKRTPQIHIIKRMGTTNLGIFSNISLHSFGFSYWFTAKSSKNTELNGTECFSGLILIKIFRSFFA